MAKNESKNAPRADHIQRPPEMTREKMIEITLMTLMGCEWHDVTKEFQGPDADVTRARIIGKPSRIDGSIHMFYLVEYDGDKIVLMHQIDRHPAKAVTRDRAVLQELLDDLEAR